MRFTIGVDVGKRSHQAAAYNPTTNRPLGQVRFTVDRAGFERFHGFLQALPAEQQQILIGVEATGHYHVTLTEFLLESGYAVVVVSPYQVTQFRRSQGKKAKTDRLDAGALARFLAVTSNVPLAPLDPTLAELRELTRFRADLVYERARALNRLHGAVDLAFPELLGLLRPLDSRTVLDVLVAYPTAAAIAAADPYEFAQRLGRASRRTLSPDQLQALRGAAQTSIATRQAPLGLAHRVRALARQVSQLTLEIAELQAAIEQTFGALGYCAQDFPIGGAVSLGTILAEAGDITHYASAKQFLAHFGWCPADTQSGQYKDAHPTLSKAGNRFVRRVIWMLAIMAVRHPGPYRTYFDRRTAAGKNKMDTLVAIGRKLLTTMYAILKTGRRYDPLYQHPSAPALPAAA